MKKKLLILDAILIALLLIGCSSPTESSATFTISYSGNGNDSGVVPSDSNLYLSGETGTVLDPGNLGKTDYVFLSWNEKADGTGESYYGGDPISIDSSDITLYAIWSKNQVYYSLSYDGNNADSGSVLVESKEYVQNSNIEILDEGSLIKDGYIFENWNTSPNGDGDDYLPGEILTIKNDIKLYAQWKQVYSIGDIGPSGVGRIFWLDADRIHGYEAAPQSAVSKGDWWNGSYILISGAAGSAIGAGKGNTDSIIDSQGAGDYAASISRSYTGGGLNDWFLPSIDELSSIYENLVLPGIVTISDTSMYWASSQKDSQNAWSRAMNSTFISDGNTSVNSHYNIWPIRAF